MPESAQNLLYPMNPVSAIQRLFQHQLLALCFTVLCLASIPLFAFAQNLSEGKLRASYIYNFAKNIIWPNESELVTFKIGLYKTQDQELVSTLKILEKNAQLRGKSITVDRVRSLKALSNYQLLFTENETEATIANIYQEIDGKPILLVSSSYSNKQQVMINLKAAVQGRVKFEVNKSNIINQGLKPLPELILNGGTEIDVAKLFRQGQASLIALQKKLATRESNLVELTKKIELQEKKNGQLENRLQSLNRNIEQSSRLVSKQKSLLTAQKKEIEKSDQDRQQLVKEVARRTRELETKRVALDASRKELDDIAQEIEVREKRLESLNGTIKLQESQLKEKETEIVALDEQVSSQQVVLRYLWGMVALGVLLVVTVFVAYTIKQRDNTRLAARGRALQLATDKLAIAKKKAELASQAKSDFLSLMSHELRTPLQAIIGYTHVVIEDMEEEGHYNQVDDLQRVIQNGERLLKMINGVLDLAKIESGKMELVLSSTDIAVLIEEAKNAVRPQLEKNQNELKVDLHTASQSPILDREKLLHILINLLSNATKFTERGLITLSVEHSAVCLHVCVEDSGIGMTPEQQRQIFERFEQVDSSTTRKFQGSGLGLSISRQFCTLMGGEISVESEVGVGSKFVMDIPLPIVEKDQKDDKKSA